MESKQVQRRQRQGDYHTTTATATAAATKPDRKAVLQRLNGRAAARKPAPREMGGAERHSAAQSHVQNQRYMDDFHDALDAMGFADSKDDGRADQMYNGTATGSAAFHCTSPADSNVWRQPASDRWGAGPVDGAGTLYDLSDRPLLACSLFGHELLVGSSDHAAYVVDLNRKNRVRKLYTKTDGHTEWVNCVAFTSDGLPVTGGMDGKICLWDRGTWCSYLTWRGIKLSSVSKVVADERLPWIFAADYDGCITAWDLSRRDRSSFEGAVQLSKHSAPVLDFTYKSRLLVSAARDGTLFAWDVATGSMSKRYRAHTGHATCVAAMSGESNFVSGGQDGFLKLWDIREPKSSQKIPAHTSREQTGAVGQITVCSDRGSEQLISFGADKAICVHDMRMTGRELYRWEHHRNFIYCMSVTGSRFVTSGAADGMVLVHDLTSGDLCYGMGACQNGAVRALTTNSDHLYLVNEDGDALEYSF